MNHISSTQAKQEFGELLMRSQVAPISVTRNGKPVAVIMSETEYQKMKLKSLRMALLEGELSGDAGILNMQKTKNKARSIATNAQNL
ncbi:MAG: type II toxin-antitoxin system Phd/YefM family antitoxin [Proteobacteria bacterium]|nr:type II toxin-antitoxin system Phd/YefM family antitoxin [Pseudomonadota bacterium]